jgi:hypothetical protein
MAKLITVTFKGGYHNRDGIKLKIDIRYLETSDKRFLSEYQIKRLKHHFCRIKDCCCPSYRSADVTYPSDITIVRR